MVVSVKPFPRRRGGSYWLDKEPYESVTSVLSGSIPSPGLEYFKREQQFLRICSDPERFLGGSFADLEAAARAELEKAADRGSTVHSLAEALDAGSAVDLDAVPEAFRGYARALVTFERDMKPLTLHSEATVYHSTHRYAGTLDRICEIGGRTVLLDRKTRKIGKSLKRVFAENILQVTAYRYCDVLLTKDIPPSRVEMPEIEVTAVCLLGEDGTYSYQEVTAPFSTFLSALEVFRFLKGAS